MDTSKFEIERLGRRMSLSARSQPGLIGSAIAVWEAAHPGHTAISYLKCDENRLWRMAVTPKPSGAQLVERSMELAADIGVYPLGLLNILRFAENAAAFAETSEDGEMLMAALDADKDQDDES